MIDDNGVLTISPSNGKVGKLEDWGAGVAPWFTYCSKITHVKFEKEVHASTCYGMFRNCSLLETVDFGQFNIDESQNMQYMNMSGSLTLLCAAELPRWDVRPWGRAALVGKNTVAIYCGNQV